MSRVSDVDLSRAVSHALRHEPWLYELELDDQGWTPVEHLLEALRGKGGAWRSIDRQALVRMLASASKQRHELDGNRIRALYGHSVPQAIEKQSSVPPSVLFHGTSTKTWESIEVTGLLPMGRQYVHLSVDLETATAVGKRTSPRPIILSIEADKASVAGTEFYRGNDLVWLAHAVPPQFIRPVT